jgi:hypothetical protein
MSLDIFLFAIDRNGDAAPFDRSIAERAFEGFATHTETDEWGLRDSDGGLCSADISIDAGPNICCIAINRPPFTEWFWNAMFEILRQTRTFLMWGSVTDAPGYCVANPDWQSYMPPDLFEDDGPPAMVLCGADIEAAINASGV